MRRLRDVFLSGFNSSLTRMLDLYFCHTEQFNEYLYRLCVLTKHDKRPMEIPNLLTAVSEIMVIAESNTTMWKFI